MSAEPYNRGRADYKEGCVIPPKEYTSVEKMQWDAGYIDEHKRNPSPIHISALRNVASAFQQGRKPTSEDIDTLLGIADCMERHRK